MSERFLFSAALVAYALATVMAMRGWRRGFDRQERGAYLMMVAGLVPHTAALMARGFSLRHCPVTNLFESLMFVTWAVVLGHLVLGAWSRMRFLVALAAPLVLVLGIFALQPALDQPAEGMVESRAVVSLHAGLVLLAYGAFAVGAASAVLYLVQEHDLKFHKVRALLSQLPSMERLEQVCAQAMMTGWILLSVGLVMAVFLVMGDNVATARRDPKVAWSVLVWVGYGVLLVLRWRRRWGPRPLAVGAVGSFAFVVLTFWGTNLLSPLHQ
jgi:ABC-type uncharacterized transport system permease subunit